MCADTDSSVNMCVCVFVCMCVCMCVCVCVCVWKNRYDYFLSLRFLHRYWINISRLLIFTIYREIIKFITLRFFLC